MHRLIPALVVLALVGCNEEIRFSGGGRGGGMGGLGGPFGGGDGGGGWVSPEEKMEKSRHSDVAKQLTDLGARLTFDDEQSDYPIVEISFSFKSPSEEDQKKFAEAIAKIDTLRVVNASHGGAIGDYVIGAVSEIPSIRELHLDSTSVSLDGAKTLGGMTNLEVLELGSAHFGVSGLSELSKLVNLRELSYSTSYQAVKDGERALNDAAAAHLAGLVALEKIEIGMSNLTNDGVAHLAGLVNLKELSLYDSEIDDDGLAHLSKMTKLETLGLANCEITDAGLVHLADLVAVKSLDLDNTGITGSGFEHLKGWTNLERLELVGSAATGEGLDLLPSLKILVLGTSFGDVSEMQIDDDALAKLAGATSLVELDLTRLDVGDEGLEHLAALPLTTLNAGETRITGTCFAKFTNPRLETLTLSGCPVSEEGTAAIGKLSSLNSLDLSESTVTDAAVAKLASLPQLRSLSLSYTDVGDEAMKSVGRLRTLANLSLNGTAVGDSGLTHLTGLSEAFSIGVEGTLVTQAGADAVNGRIGRYSPLDDGYPPIAPYQRLAPAHGSLVVGCFVGEDRVAAVGDGQAVHVWNLEDGRLVRSIPIEMGSFPTIRSIQATPDGKKVVVAADVVHVVDLESGEAQNLPESNSGTAVVSPDGKWLVSGRTSYDDDVEKGVVLWNLEIGKEAAVLDASNERPMSFAISGDGKRFAGSMYGGSIHIWNLESRERNTTLSDGLSKRADALLFLDDAGTELLVVVEGEAFVMDVESGERKRDLGTEQVSYGLKLAVAPDGRSIAFKSSTYKPFVLVNVADGRELQRIENGSRHMTPLAVSADSKWMLTTADFGDGRSFGHVWSLPVLRGDE